MKTKKDSHDPQKFRVYAWEDEYVHHPQADKIPFDQVQLMVDYIWSEENLSHPPKVKKLVSNSACEAKASRLFVWVKPDGITSTILLHELAHSMTSTFEGESARHGPRYVGVYLKLLEKYARMDLIELCKSCNLSKVEYNFSGKVFK